VRGWQAAIAVACEDILPKVCERPATEAGDVLAGVCRWRRGGLQLVNPLDDRIPAGNSRASGSCLCPPHSKGCSSSSSATPGRVGKFMAQGEGCSPKGGEALALAEEIQPSHRKVQHRETVGVEALHRGGQALPDHRHEVGDVVLEQQRRGILAEQ
jgi:hypothetical protein